MNRKWQFVFGRIKHLQTLSQFSMKKSYLAALAALTLSTSAIASVSLSGNASVTYNTSNNSTNGAANLIIEGQFEESGLIATLDLVSGSLGEAYFATSIGPINLTAYLSEDRLVASLHTEITDSLAVTLMTDNSDSWLQVDYETGDCGFGEFYIQMHSAGHAEFGACIVGFDLIVNTAGTWNVGTTINNIDLQFDRAGALFASTTIGQTQVNYVWMDSHKIELSRDLDSGANLKVAYDSDGDNLQVVTSVEF
jgi:hypothetical protein